ncbi:uncharacterized protein LOC143900666, partial [Temnothorax americanus]|uniref:uncharacterized protein LOC143900666 n=1 Tax=Temnothorax americanus TaxID=1964332 RepID=UPI00406853B9
SRIQENYLPSLLCRECVSVNIARCEYNKLKQLFSTLSFARFLINIYFLFQQFNARLSIYASYTYTNQWKVLFFLTRTSKVRRLILLYFILFVYILYKRMIILISNNCLDR